MLTTFVTLSILSVIPAYQWCVMHPEYDFVNVYTFVACTAILVYATLYRAIKDVENE